MDCILLKNNAKIQVDSKRNSNHVAFTTTNGKDLWFYYGQ